MGNVHFWQNEVTPEMLLCMEISNIIIGAGDTEINLIWEAVDLDIQLLDWLHISAGGDRNPKWAPFVEERMHS